jgi:hypothetical protein
MEEEARRLQRARMKKIPTTDYGFKLEEGAKPSPSGASEEARKKAEDYGFKLD